ncbi:MAG: cupin domain-containing protein [Desulfobacterales bacterium]|nr:MAG: cupin domain-containing protein [Desulfobacterales bacterium]
MPYVTTPAEMEGFRIHPGVTAKLVAVGKEMTGLISIWEPNSLFAPHVHPNEQIGICIEGEAIFTIDGKDYLVRKGDVYNIPANVPHGERNEGATPAVFMECFAPVREDLVKHQKFMMPFVE